MEKIDSDEGGTTTHYYLECEPGPEEWHWDAKSTKLLLELYIERRSRFRDPKNRKRALWSEIVDEMERAGYKGINEDICDRKMRNMKKTYRTCREGMRRTGRKRVSWEYYNTFDDLFQHELQPTTKTENAALAEESIADICSSMASPAIKADDTIGELSVTNENQRQLLILERSRVAAIRELSKRIDESNSIQRERNELLREFLNQL